MTHPGSADYVAPAERIAVFDNDGTLWAEQPMYFQLAFALDRIKALSVQYPQWQTLPPFKHVLDNNLKAVAAAGEQGLLEIMSASHTGVTTEELSTIVGAWLATARHPQLGRAYPELVYQPMLELLAYLRANGFKTFIVSGGGVEFIRVFAEQVYGIPPEQVVGSSFATRYQIDAHGKPVLLKESRVEFIDDGPGKASGINRFIGRRPIMAFGNSDGDLQMLEWTAGNPRAQFVALIHHTDAEREFAYDRASPVGRLDKALDQASARRWLIVDMRRDWRTVFGKQQCAGRLPSC
ncbi:MAG TPA: HAD family hydrolase [Steroidobacteraceae bacterium]|nr:HAD family hydrolase [Steroidobacteraceae bacterium]